MDGVNRGYSFDFIFPELKFEVVTCRKLNSYLLKLEFYCVLNIKTDYISG